MTIRLESVPVAVVGSKGFIGSNLCVFLEQLSEFEVLAVDRETSRSSLVQIISRSAIVIFAAGVNRSEDENEFYSGNVEYLRYVLSVIEECKVTSLLVYASTSHAGRDTPYGKSKLKAETLLESFVEKYSCDVEIYRLPGIFGKWAKAEYNSVVATFCTRISRGFEINITDPEIGIQLIYIDDLVDFWVSRMRAHLQAMVEGDRQPTPVHYVKAQPIYEIKLGELAEKIKRFALFENSPNVPCAEYGLDRALYSTYLSYVPLDGIRSPVSFHDDARGRFCEFVKTPGFGQVSFFSCMPGVTRGDHFHRSKAERFLVLAGTAKFNMQCLRTGDMSDFEVSHETPEVVRSIPGSVHSITNIGPDVLLVLVWANEQFDDRKPDTYRRIQKYG